MSVILEILPPATHFVFLCVAFGALGAAIAAFFSARRLAAVGGFCGGVRRAHTADDSSGAIFVYAEAACVECGRA